MKRSFVVVTDAVVDVQLGAELPGVARVEEPGVDEDLTVWVADGDGGTGGHSSEVVGQSIAVAVKPIGVSCRSICLRHCLGAVEGE